MAVVQNGPEDRIGKMDMELKELFADQQTFISEALQGVERRLGGRMGKLERRADKFEETVKAGFKAVDTRLDSIDRNVAEIRKLLRKR